MNITNRKLSIFILSLLIVSLILVGCSTQKKPLQNQGVPGQGQTQSLPGTQNSGGQQLQSPSKGMTGNGADRAAAISRQLVAMGNIKRAPVVLDGNTAIVGVQLTDGSQQAINKMNTGIQNMPNQSNIGSASGTQNMINPSNVINNIGGQMGSNQGTTNKLLGRQGNLGSGILGGQGGTDMGGATNPNNSPNAQDMARLSDQQQNSNINTIITQKVKAIDPTLSKVIVTTDNTLIDRIQKVSTTIQNELPDIMNKVQPNAVNR